MLPKELLEMFLKLLPPRDLKAALLVCRSWRDVGERSKLWAWVCLRVTEQNLATMPQILDIERLKSMEKISVAAVSEELLLAIDRHQGLKVLDASACDFSSIEPGLLARVVAKLEEVDFNTKLTTEQCDAIFRLATGNNKLKKLSMGFCDMSLVDPETLAMVVARLEEVDFSYTRLTTQQSQAIFKLANGDSKLKKLSMVGSDLSSVDHETLARVVNKLKNAELCSTRLTAQQSQAIFRLATGDSKLKKLAMSSNNLSSLDEETMARVVDKLEEVDLGGTKLTTQHFEAIFRFVNGDSNGDSNSKLRKLDISFSNLSSLDPESLAKAIAKLEEVDLASSNLTSQQCEAIFRFAATDSKLKKLHMALSNLSSVDQGTLAKAINNLEDVELSFTNVTAQQCEAIFTLAASQTKLKKLLLVGSKLSSVDPESLARAIANIQDVDLSYSEVTDPQREAIIEVCGVSKLNTLNIRGNPRAQVTSQTFSL